MKTSFINCLEKPVTINEFGSNNNPAILMIHGNSAHSGFFIPMIRFLELKYHVITLDLPGHKQSETWEKDNFNRQNLALMFNSVLEHFNISAVNAFGFSMGGFMLLETFDLIPAIKKIAIAGHPPLHSVEDMNQAYYLNQDSALYLQDTLTEQEIERIYNAVIHINDKIIEDEIKASLRNTNPKFREGCMQIAQQCGDQIARLNNCRIPIAVIHASDDTVIQYEYLKKIQIENLWEQKIQLIKGSGHFMIVEKPKELAFMLDNFFSIK